MGGKKAAPVSRAGFTHVVLLHFPEAFVAQPLWQWRRLGVYRTI
jgi:hypothetical protein